MINIIRPMTNENMIYRYKQWNPIMKVQLKDIGSRQNRSNKIDY